MKINNNMNNKNCLCGPSREVFRISEIQIPRWRKYLFSLISKLLNVREEFPYRWRYTGKKIDTKMVVK